MASLEQLQRDVGRRVAECRQNAGLTQLELAEALDISLQYVQRIEAGQVNMTLASLKRWAEELGVTPAALLDRPTSSRPGRGRPPRTGQFELPFRRVKRSPRAIPVYGFKVAAGAWSEWQQARIVAWVSPPPGVRAARGLFLVQVVGRSMEPKVPDGAWCLCSRPWPNPGTGQIGIFLRSPSTEPEGGGTFTLKQYAPRAAGDAVGGALKSRNPQFPPIAPNVDQLERPFARLIKVVEGR